jgi:hypothetical protein
MNELLPVLSGLFAGAAIGAANVRRPLLWTVVSAVVLGTLATIVSGEFLTTWEFLLIDVPLVALCGAATAAVVTAVRRRMSTDPERPV